MQRVIYVKSMRWGALGPLRPLRGSRAPSCDFASQSSSLRSSGDLTASPQVHLALRQPDDFVAGESRSSSLRSSGDMRPPFCLVVEVVVVVVVESDLENHE